MNLTRSLDAESEALSLTDVKNHLRISGTDDDDVLRFFISAIRRKTETYLQQTLVTSTWVYKLDGFPEEICLPMFPVQSITSVQYVDSAGATQTFSNIQFDQKGRLRPSYSNVWPTAREQYDSVTVTYIAGQTHAGNVEPDIKLAMLLWIGDCDINREDSAFGSVSEIPNSAKNILNMYRNWQVT